MCLHKLDLSHAILPNPFNSTELICGGLRTNSITSVVGFKVPYLSAIVQGQPYRHPEYFMISLFYVVPLIGFNYVPRLNNLEADFLELYLLFMRLCKLL